MTSSYSQNRSLEKPSNGDYVNTWNTPVNTNYDVIDVCFGGSTTINVVGVSGTTVLTATQYRTPNITFSGTLSANVVYQLPSGIGGTYSIYNNTSGSFALTINSGGAGRSVVIAQGSRTGITCDGTNVDLFSSTPVTLAGSNQQIIYNSNGVLAGSSNLYFDGYILFTQRVRFLGSTNGYVDFLAPSYGPSQVYTLPNGYGNSGQLLTTDGSGGLSWTSSSSGVSSFSAGSTGLTPNSSSTGAVTLGGVLNVVNGGTGSSTVGGARSAIGAAASGSNNDITALNALSTVLTLAQGGTNASTPLAALSNLGGQIALSIISNGNGTAIGINIAGTVYYLSFNTGSYQNNNAGNQTVNYPVTYTTTPYVFVGTIMASGDSASGAMFALVGAAGTSSCAVRQQNVTDHGVNVAPTIIVFGH